MFTKLIFHKHFSFSKIKSLNKMRTWKVCLILFRLLHNLFLLLITFVWVNPPHSFEFKLKNRVCTWEQKNTSDIRTEKQDEEVKKRFCLLFPLIFCFWCFLNGKLECWFKYSWICEVNLIFIKSWWLRIITQKEKKEKVLWTFAINFYKTLIKFNFYVYARVYLTWKTTSVSEMWINLSIQNLSFFFVLIQIKSNLFLFRLSCSHLIIQ